MSSKNELLSSRLERESLLTRDRSQVPIKDLKNMSFKHGQINGCDAFGRPPLTPVLCRRGRFTALTVSNEKSTELIDTFPVFTASFLRISKG